MQYDVSINPSTPLFKCIYVDAEMTGKGRLKVHF